MEHNADSKLREDTVLEVLANVLSSFSEDEIAEVHRFLGVGEVLLALETICHFIVVRRKKIEEKSFSVIEGAFDTLGEPDNEALARVIEYWRTRSRV
jgi:hypothetical protein